jgi:ABC-2 type transport system ATP-binding protein
MGVIEISGLRKEYHRVFGEPRVAVDRLDLSVPEGGVFGFLGPNGSGKTTTIRCLLGLVAPTAGACRVLGADVSRSALPRVIDRVGAIVETPAFYPSFSGRRNLRLLARLAGIGNRTVDDVLDRVGLSDRADDAVKRYSLGMRQRLGLAAVLLKDPALLILDEPANGLDPAGIREIRLLLRRLGDEGRTVFVSSHQLGEIQQTCDRVAILRAGHCIQSGPVRDVLTNGRGVGLLVRVDDMSAAHGVFAAAGIRTQPTGDGMLLVDHPPAAAGHVTELLARRQLWVTELRPQELSLEDVFLELTEAAS